MLFFATRGRAPDRTRIVGSIPRSQYALQQKLALSSERGNNTQYAYNSNAQAPLLVHPLELLRRRARAVIVGISKHFGVADTHVCNTRGCTNADVKKTKFRVDFDAFNSLAAETFSCFHPSARMHTRARCSCYRSYHRSYKRKKHLVKSRSPMRFSYTSPQFTTQQQFTTPRFNNCSYLRVVQSP